ncbi:MAG: formylmethanofuran dehydrogenase [Hyphomicrobium sp.]
MTARDEGAGLGERPTSELFENVTCPFCGILCDDLEISRTGSTLKVLKNGCERAHGGFERTLPKATPMVKGKAVELHQAIEAAAALIKKAQLPLYGGVATDVDGVRAALSIADRSGGVIDHALSEGQFRNLKVLQSSGWIMSTLTEARNRADLFVIVGTDVHKLHGRFFERVVCTPESMFEEQPSKRTVVFIGRGLDASAATGPRIDEVITLPCKLDKVGDVLAALRARLRGTDLKALETANEATQATSESTRSGFLSALLPQQHTAKTSPSPGPHAIDGVSLADIDALAERCKNARYGVMVWAPPGLNFPNADLTVQLISDVVKDLNVTTRFAGLSLGGNDGVVSGAAVGAWQTGYPLRLSYANGKPDYDLYRYSIGRMLVEKEGDLLVWIATISPDIVPPETNLPTIVLGTPGLKLKKMPDVFIPVGTPGVDHAGVLVRCDNVVSLPLKNLNRAPLPRAADVLAALEAAL